MIKLSFDLWSDLHCETDKDANALNIGVLQESDIAIVAGDMAHHPDLSMDIIEDFAKYYDHVLFVDGNGELKDPLVDPNNNFSIISVEQKMRDRAKNIPNAHYLNDSPFTIGDTVFIGANGHWDYRSGGRGVTPKAAKDWNAAVINERFNTDGYDVVRQFCDTAARDVGALVQQVKDLTANTYIKTIIPVIHTVPLQRLLTSVPKGAHPFANAIMCNTEMARILDADTQNKIKTWLFGHQHAPVDENINGVRFVANPMGYPSETKVMYPHGYCPQTLIL